MRYRGYRLSMVNTDTDELQPLAEVNKKSLVPSVSLNKLECSEEDKE